MNRAAFACAGQLQNLVAQVASRHVSCFPRDEGLARSRSLPAIGSDGSISRDQIELRNRRPNRIGADLGHDGV